MSNCKLNLKLFCETQKILYYIYQIGAGVNRESIFFGRQEIISHIIKSILQVREYILTGSQLKLNDHCSFWKMITLCPGM